MQVRTRRPSEAQPNRMGALAKLPVFYDLAGKRVVVAGGTAAAAWKAELLAACGAHVEIFASDLEDDMSALLARGAAAGRLTHHARPWALDIFDLAKLALCDAADDEEARAFFCAARAAGVPVNVIDKPAFCQFQFGSIVNRSPVVVGISTDGAAPILGQAIRRRVETLLPPPLAAWAGFAKEIRARVTDHLAPGQQRRRFWERFVDHAFGAAPDEASRAALHDDIEAIAADEARANVGRVTLVGAGPGDPELLTLKAVRALQAADVILFDDLVSDGVLELARREAKRMLVGKRGGRESCRQDDINALMLTLARAGKNVVRLKSGDPMVFGRAGEEIAAIERAGIKVNVVPGITAASGLAADLKTSLTHRDHAQSVRFVTGHARSGRLPEDLDWRGLADARCTLVFYMGGRTAPAIAERLLAHGLAVTTPVVVGAAVSRPDAQTRMMTLADLKADGAQGLSSAPVLVAIGEALAQSQVLAASEQVPTRTPNEDGGRDIPTAARLPGADGAARRLAS
ncbi:MAG: siroheme synthase CysG [Pseudomonadota bacterium]